MQWNILVSNCL